MRSVLENLLLHSRVLDEKRLRKGNDVVLETGCTLAHALVKLGLVSDRALAKLIAQTLNLRMVDPTRLQIHASALAQLAGPRAYALRVIPVRIRATATGQFIYVAMSDPTDHAAVREVESTTGRELVPAVCEERALETALRTHYASELTVGPPPALSSTPPSEPLSDEPPPVVLGASLSGEISVGGALEEDDGYFTESTEELVTVYSRTMMKAGAETDDNDLAWLAERQALAGGPASEAAARRAAEVAPPDDPTEERPMTPEMRRAVPLSSEPAPTEALVPETPPDVVSSVRPPTCIVVENARLRAWLRAKLHGRVDRLHLEPDVAHARAIGDHVPMGFVVVVQPPVKSNVGRELQSLKEMAGSPWVIVIGGDPRFEKVHGVDRWAEVPSPATSLPDVIVQQIKSLQAPK